MDEILDCLENFDSTSSYQSTDGGIINDGVTPDTSISISESISNNNFQHQSSFANDSFGSGQIMPSTAEGIMSPSQSFDHSVTPASHEHHLHDNMENVIGGSITTQSIDSGLSTTTDFEINALKSESHSLATNDNLVNTPSTDNLDVRKEDLDMLQSKADGIERSEHKGEPSFTGKACPTSHGCSGATSCDLSYGDYPY